MPAKLGPDRSRGYIIAAGALADAARAADTFTRLLALLAPQPRVVIVASGEAADGDDSELESLLRAAGAAETMRVLLRTRADSEQLALLAAIDQAQLVLLQTDQPLRLSTLIGGTRLARALRRRNAEGMAVAGCGPAAALLCEHMVAHGEQGATPRQGGVQFAPGLGLTNRVVIDQGGHAGDRLGRLLGALALNPFALGLGIDAATAAIIGPDNVLEVLGAGGITLLDPAEMAESNVADVTPGAPIRITNLRLHALTAGARYDLDFRQSL
ncbi:MAG: cyanophycinase [Dokdonella sp.]|uniref:cyanophycinase n=1 Tax=Dokdonella sp. TaxID=2291710 RepID=UPI0025BD6204|nr:cyanophycinase [Dokdonella sp.]MBX3701332.1 cyanophycinase [Dokdonella sp.]MCW5577569.1 cyanophycinase [Dokdonella sp.]